MVKVLVCYRIDAVPNGKLLGHAFLKLPDFTQESIEKALLWIATAPESSACQIGDRDNLKFKVSDVMITSLTRLDG